MEARVQLAEAKRCQALQRNDAAALAALLSDQLVFVHSSGTQDSKAQLLDKIRDGVIRYQEVRLTPQRVQLLAGERSAVVGGEMNATIVVAGAERRVRSSYLAVWSLEDDGPLRLVAHQGTALPLA